MAQDYSGAKKAPGLHQLSTSDRLSVKNSGTSQIPNNDHNLHPPQSVVDMEIAKCCYDIAATSKELSSIPVASAAPSMATTLPQSMSELTLMSLQPLSVNASVSLKPGISTTTRLLKLQTLRPPVVSLSSSSVTISAAPSASISASSQMCQGKQESPAVSTSSVSIAQSQSQASPYKASLVQHIALSPVVKNQDFGGPWASQSPVSQSVHVTVLPRPSFSSVPSHRALGFSAKLPNPETNFLSGPAVNSSIIDSCQGAGHVDFHESEQQNLDMSCSKMTTHSVVEVRTQHKVDVPNTLYKQVCQTDPSDKALDKIPESSSSILCTEEPGVKAICTNKDQTISGKGYDSTVNNIWDAETANLLSLAGMICVNRSEEINCCGHTQDEGSFVFAYGSTNKGPGDILPENEQTVDISCEKNEMGATIRNSNDMLLHKNHSLNPNSLDDTPQIDITQHFSSLHVSEKLHTVADTEGQRSTGPPVVDTTLLLPITPCSRTKKATLKPNIAKGSALPAQNSLKNTRKKRIKSLPEASKEEKVKWKKKNEERLKSTTENRTPKEVPVSSSCVPGGASFLLLKGGFISDVHLTHSVVQPISKSESVKKSEAKENAEKCSISSNINLVLKTKVKNGNDGNLITGVTPKRRVATEEQVMFPLLHGWRREIRVRKLDNRLKGETWYYAPCGRRLKQFPEVIKYLKRHEKKLNGVTREHFSFSPRMPVGDFYEERDTSEGKKWFILANEEVPSMIMAITGRRGRPPNPNKKIKPQSRVLQPKRARRKRPGRPSKLKVVDLLSKIDTRMLKILEAKEELTEDDKAKLAKITKKMEIKARIKRMEGVNNRTIRQQKLKAKMENTRELLQEDQAQYLNIALSNSLSDQLKKPGNRRKFSVEHCPKKVCPAKRITGAPTKAKASAKAELEAQAQAALRAKKMARQAQARRRLEERKRQQKILEELKKPTEDMCLTDHTPLPALSRIPGLVLSGLIFSHCITVIEFLHSYGKVLGIQVPKDIPTLATLQEGLLGRGKSQTELIDLLISLVNAVLHDPGLPPHCQSVKILGEKLVDVELRHSTVSEVLRVFLESHGFEKKACNSLRTKSFQTLSPEVKATILAFLVEELNGSNTVINEIDKTLENMASYKKNKWIIEGRLRKMKAALSSKIGCSEEERCVEERRRSTRFYKAGDENLADRSSLENGSSCKQKGNLKIREAGSSNIASVPELERQIDKLTKHQEFFQTKQLKSSYCMRAMSLGQDRYRRRYWLLPNIGGVLVEGPEEILASGNILLNDESMPSVEKKVMSSMKVDNIVEPHLSPMHSATKAHLPFCPHPSNITPSSYISSSSDADPLPGEVSLMSTPRGLGRPRKIRPEVELHLQSLKNRRSRRSKGADNSKGANQSEDFMKDLKDGRQTLLKESSNQAPRPERRCKKAGGAGDGNFEAGAVKRRGRPRSSPFQEMEQKYFTQLVVKPIPQEMVKGWWWIREPEELTSILTALHPRGVREKVLRKNITKHMVFLIKYCRQPMTDPIFRLKVEDDRPVLEAVKQSWEEQKHAMQIDISILEMVEDMENRVLGADLQLKIFTAPEPDSTRKDLQYYEHEVDPREDWMIKSKKERWNLLRIPTNPLDLAVMRLINLEKNIERRYLKGPLWNLAEVTRLAPLTFPPGEGMSMDTVSLENEITPRLRIWRQALDRCRSPSQLSLCLLQLEKAIAWEKSIVKVTCHVCHKGDNDACLLLCDGCDCGWHMFCLRPKVTQVPEGDWFCPACSFMETGEDCNPKLSARQRANAQKRHHAYIVESYTEERRHRQNTNTQKKCGSGPFSRTGCSKRRRMGTRNQPDFTYCEIILMEMESHADAWPFLEPVNPRLVPGYRRIIKNPMDFLTMREKILQGCYNTCEEFAADAQLVFNNCELFNEDTSEVGMAGHSMRRFFESRWSEFYSNSKK